MKTWKATLIGGLVVANGAIANVTITGERTGVTPLPSLNMSPDLRQIAYRSKRPAPLKFPKPQPKRTGEIKLAGAFDPSDPRDRNGNVISPEMSIPCTPLLFRQCGNPEITAWSGPGVSALRFSLGPDVDVDTFRTARLKMNELLEEEGLEPENKRVDGLALSLDDLEIFAKSAR